VLPKYKQVGEFLKGPVLSFLRKWVLEFLMKKVLGRVVGGVYGWVITFAFDKIWKPIIVPIWNRIVRALQKYVIHRELVRKGKKTEEAKSGDEWKSAIDDLFDK